MPTLKNVIENVSGSVGIGTTSPAQALELRKNVGSAIALLNYNNSVKFNINASSAGVGYVGMVTNHDLLFVTNDTERARLNTNGNLGIGSSSPAYKLDVTGEMRQSGNNFWFSGARMAGDGSGNIDINYNNGSSPSFTWYNGGTSALARITSAGCLGIGTTSPTQLLDVRGNIKLGGDNSGNYVYYVTDIERTIVRTTRSDVTQEGLLRSDGWGNFTFNKSIGLGYSLGSGPQTGNIYAAGSVGIGTSTTTSGLQIQTEGTNTTSGSFLFVRSTNASFGGGAIGVGYQYAAAVGNNFTPFRIRASTTNAIFVVNSAGVVYAGDTTGAVIYGNHDPYFAFNQDTNTGMDWAASDTLTFKTGGSERVRIDSSGQLGVGTTSPLNRLEVAGSTFNRATFKATANVQTGIQIIRTGGVSNTDWEIYSPASSTDLRFFNVADLFTFQVTGNLGIGTNSPLVKLHVNGQTYINNVGSSASTQLTFNSNGANYAHFYDLGVGLNTLAIGGASGISSAPSTPIMAWGLTSGNVGIGTTTLSSLLTLNGTYPQIIANNPTTGSGVVIQLRDNGRDAGFMGHATTTARLQFGSRGLSAVHMTIGETGNVGIGTTNPGNNLVVYNASGWAGTDLNGSSGGELRFLQSGTLKANIYASTSTGFVLNGGSEIIFQNGASEKMRLTGGNLGIGTTGPVALLDVRGSTKFGSSLSNTHQFTGSVNFGGSTYNNSIAIDKFEYFSLQPYIEGGSFPSNVLSTGGGNVPSFVTITGSASPFGKVAYNPSYYESIGDFIPVNPGETLYGEIWAYRSSGATGTGGGLYVGIARYDKDKNPIATNLALVYFIASAVNVPLSSTWTKYSGTTTLPLTHTPFNGSDGGPVRYIRPYFIINYPSGTIPTYWSGFKIRKQQLTRDAGATTISGSLGIGTTSPSSILHTAGAGDQVVRFTHTDNVVGRALTLRLTNNNATYLNSGAYVQAIQGAGIDYYSLAFGTTNNSTTSAERMRIQYDGNVGIGTTSPAYKLEVIGSTPRIHLKETGLSYATLDVENNAGSFYFGIDNSTGTGFGGAAYAGTIYKQGAYPISIWTNAVERMRITSTGNIGINAADPDGTTLRIIPFSTDAVQRVLHIGYAGSMSTGINGSYISFGNGNPSSNQLARIASYYEGATYQGSLRFYTNSNTDGANPTERMRIDYAGNVGIGTTTLTNGQVVIYNTVGNTLSLQKSAGGAALMMGSETTNYALIESIASGGVRFYTGNGAQTEKMRIDVNGNVGIGTTSPASILHLNGTAPTILTLSSTSYPSTYLSTFGVDSGARAFLIFGNNGENQIRAGRTTTGGYLDFYTNNTVAQTTLASDGNFVMRLAANGSVVIGTTTPVTNCRLTLQSSNTARFAITDSTVTANIWPTGGILYFSTETNHPIAFITNANERIRIAADGNVGIGTSNPTALLHNYRATSTATPITYIQEAASSPSKTNILLIERLNNLSAANISASSAGVRIRDHSSNYGLSVEDHSGNSYLVVRGGGNVGIGTAIPTSKLNAYGSGSNLSVFKAEGGNGTLFEVTDQLSGSLFSVNSISGIPILEVFSNNRIVAGQYGSNALVISGSKVGIGLATPLSNKSLSISGDAQVLGSFTKGSGTFLIDHPDPAKPGWKLQHSFVESPTVGDNIYRYVIDIDNTLSGSIELPSYWKFLNENPQIWINPVKHFGIAYGELNEELSVMNVYANSAGKYNILLIGTRKDPTIKRLMPEFNVEFESE